MRTRDNLDAIVANLEILGERLRGQVWRMKAMEQQCDVCGFRTKEPPIRQTLAAVRHVAPGNCAPAEYEQYCPVCDATESFQIAKEK